MIEGRVQTGDKLVLISLKKAKEIFGNELWIDEVEKILGWGTPVQVGAETIDDEMFTIGECPYALNAVCFSTASEAKLEKLQVLYKDENKLSENVSSEE